MPAEIRGKWNWCAFLFPTVFAGVNRLWLWLVIAAVPAALISLDVLPAVFVGAQVVLSIVLAARGNALAWRSRSWDSLEHFERTQRRWAWGSVVALIALVGVTALVETDGAGLVAESSTDRASRGSAAFHGANLAQGETASLAALIVDVPGYNYVDASDGEVQFALDQTDRSAVTGLSLHVVDDLQGDEIAFLQLFEFAPGILPRDPDSAVASALMGRPPTSQMFVGSQEVFLLENAAHPQSRYMYVWFRADTLAAADAGDQARLLVWLQAYLSTVGPPASAEPIPQGIDPSDPGTFTADEVTFRYPPEWTSREVRISARWHVDWSIAVHPTEGRFRHEDVRVLALGRGSELPAELANERLSALAEGRGTIEGPVPTSIGSLTGFEGRILDYERYGKVFELRVLTIIEGPIAYEISCLYERTSIEVIRGCRQVIASFRFGG